MKIAVITDDAEYVHALRAFKKPGWNIRFFKGPAEFGKTRLNQYSVIIADQSLSPTSGRAILKAISYKTGAELFLMTNGIFKEEDAHDNNINGFIDKKDPKELEDSLKYVDSKLQVKRLAWKSKTSYRTILSNGFNLRVKGRIALVEISKTLSEESKKDLGRELDALDVNGAVISFPGVKALTNDHMRLLFFIHGIFNPKHERVAFWNSEGIKRLENRLELSNLGSTVPIFETLDDAIDYLEETLLVSKI